MGMTSRERVRTVLDGGIPDRIPNALGGCETAGLHLQSYARLQEVLGLPPRPPRLDTFMANAVFETDVVEAMEGDVLLLASPRMCRSRFRGRDSEREWKEQTLWGRTYRVSVRETFRAEPDGTVVWETAGGAVCPPGGAYFDAPEPEAFRLDFDVPDPDGYRPSHDLPDDLLRGLEEAARDLYEGTGLSLWLGETIEDLQVQPAGYLGTLMLLREEPGIMHAFLGRAAEAAASQLRQLDQAVGRYVDVLSIAHDLGDNRGVTIGPDLFRAVYEPHYRELFGQWKRTTRMKVDLHTCGAVSDILGDLADCGVDVVNPVQTSAAGMDPQSLKDRFGDRLVFCGGAYDAQSVPRDADPEAVRATVRRNVEVLGKGGGYLFAGVHNLPGDIPAGHLRAMLDGWRDARTY